MKKLQREKNKNESKKACQEVWNNIKSICIIVIPAEERENKQNKFLK